MCNLYRLNRPQDQVAQLFKVGPAQGNSADEVVEMIQSLHWNVQCELSLSIQPTQFHAD